ncbi:hypothetical protein CsSME_00051717 [Camellia sinensis var. sinensis]
MVFEWIGTKCGGLLEVDSRTRSFRNLFEARLKVKGIGNGFLSTTIDVQVEGVSAAVRLKALTKPSGRREVHRQWSFQPVSDDSSTGERRSKGMEVRSQAGGLHEMDDGNGRSVRDERGNHFKECDPVINEGPNTFPCFKKRGLGIVDRLRAFGSNPKEVSEMGLGRKDSPIILASRVKAFELVGVDGL